DAQTGRPATTEAPKLEVSKPSLTERERWLLDKVEQLEKRVAQLENKSRSDKPAPATASVPSLDAAPVVSGTETATVSSGPRGIANPSAAATESRSSALPSSVAKESPDIAMPAQTKAQKSEPFSFADFTWMNGNTRTKQPAMDTKFFTPEIRVDAGYIYDFNHPKDDTIGGSPAVFFAPGINLTHPRQGGAFHFYNSLGPVLT